MFRHMTHAKLKIKSKIQVFLSLLLKVFEYKFTRESILFAYFNVNMSHIWFHSLFNLHIVAIHLHETKKSFDQTIVLDMHP